MAGRAGASGAAGVGRRHNRHRNARDVTPHLTADDLPAQVIAEMADFELTVDEVDEWLRRHGSDGATGVPDDYRPAAWLHDFCYRTRYIPKATADRWFRLAMIDAVAGEEWLWRWTGTAKAWLRWAAVRTLGGWYYQSRWWGE